MRGVVTLRVPGADAGDQHRWFTQHRQEWITETLRVFGFINREHIERKFGISSAQASLDLRLFQANNPGAITYNKSAKRYEALNAGELA